MSRGIPQPWFRPGRKTWYVTVGGVQHNLHTADKDEAFKRWHAVMSQPAESAEPVPTTVIEVLAVFVDWSEKNQKVETFEWHRHYLRRFEKTIPRTLFVTELKPLHVTKWLDVETRWGVNSRRAAIASLKRAFNWAVAEGHIPSSPIASVRKPTGKRRETILTDEQRQLVVDAATDDEFRDFVTLIQETGARPQEVRAVEGRHVDLANGVWIFPASEHKTGAKTGQPRIVYLNSRAREITKRLLVENPVGPLCRNSRGGAWSRNAIRLRFKRLRQRLKDKVPSDLCAYVFRHTFATTALVRGVDAITVAELLGHKDVAMLSRVYQHVRIRPVNTMCRFSSAGRPTMGRGARNGLAISLAADVVHGG